MYARAALIFIPVRLFSSNTQTRIIPMVIIPQIAGSCHRWPGLVIIIATSPNNTLTTTSVAWLYTIELRTLLPLPVCCLRIYHFTPVLSGLGIIRPYNEVTALAPNIFIVSTLQSCLFNIKRILIERIQKANTANTQTIIRNPHLAVFMFRPSCSKSIRLNTSHSKAAVINNLSRNFNIRFALSSMTTLCL
ncbi:hypothetical protein ES707_21433 [subsurface metagenome]